MRKRIATVFIMALIAISSFVCAMACGCSNEKGLEIKVLDYAYLPDVYINQEFDALNVLEEIEDGVEYGLSEVFCLDKNLEREDIPFDGTKFTQTKPYDVLITLYAKKGKIKVEKEIELKLLVESTGIQSELISSWNDQGVVKVMTAEPEYLYQDEKGAIKVSYFGSYNPGGDGNNIGGLKKDLAEFSKTSWENEVLTLNIYNIADFDLEFGVMFIKDGKLFGDLPYLYNPFNLKSKQWTTLSWSFRVLGMTYNIFEEGISVAFKVRIPNTDGLVSPYNYSFIISGLDITDYSAEKFPNLETRTEDEIFNDTPGDSIDKCLVNYYMPEYTPGDGYPYRYFYTTVDVSVDESILCNSSSNSKSSVKYVVNPSDDIVHSQYCTPLIALTKLGEDGRINDYVEYENLANTVVKFKVKNDAEQEVRLKWIFEHGNGLSILSNFVGEFVVPNDEEWHEVKIKINAANAEKLLTTSGALNICSVLKTSEKNASFYIDDFNIVQSDEADTPKTPEEEIQTLLLDSIALSGYNSYPYRYHFGLLENSVSQTEYYGSGVSIKYFMQENADYSPSQYGAVPISLNKNTLQEIAEISECSDFSSANVRFYVKNAFATALKVRIYCQEAVSITDAPLFEESVINDGGWHCIEIPISDVLTKLDAGCAFVISSIYTTGTLGTGAEFYIDGFEIYNKETVTLNNLNSIIVNYAEGDSNVTAEVITDIQYLREGSQSAIKYTLTNDGVDRGYYAGTRTGNFILDNTGILFDLYKEEITDWGTAYIGFYIKNVSSHDLYVAPRFQTATGEGSSKQWQGTVLKYEWNQAHKSVAKNSTSWQYIEMSLNDIASVADNMYGQTQAKGQFYTENLTGFKLYLAVSGYGMTNEGDSATFYIDGLSIYNK